MNGKAEGTFVWRLDSNAAVSTGTIPRSRCKHAACLYDHQVYIFGGKGGNVPFKDLWKYDIRSGSWVRLTWSGDRLPNLQDHTMVPYQNKIYIFGGSFQFGADPEIPFWVFDLGTVACKKQTGTAPFPEGRRGHSAVIFKNTMCIFAGFIDMKRSSNELWSFNFDMGRWHPLKAVDGSTPSGRHGHSAVVHAHFMWIYGGLADLLTKDDLWFWDFGIECWTRVKCKQGPPSLEGHSACTLHNLMLIYGGSHEGVLQNDLWAFHYDLTVWTKINCTGPEPHPCTKHTALLALHQDWCSRPQCIDAVSGLRRATSCPLSSPHLAVRGTRLISSSSSRLGYKTTSSKTSQNGVEMADLGSSDTASKGRVGSGSNPCGKDQGSSKEQTESADADTFCVPSKKTESLLLLTETDNTYSAHDVSKSLDVNDHHTYQNGRQFCYENCNFVDSSLDLCASSAGFGSSHLSNGSLQDQDCTFLRPELDSARNVLSKRGEKKARHVLAVNLLGTPTKSQASASSSSDLDKAQFSEPEESLWVEMEIIGHGAKAIRSPSTENLILQELDDGEANATEHRSFYQPSEQLTRQRDEEKEKLPSHDQWYDPGCRKTKVAWASPTHKVPDTTQTPSASNAEAAVTSNGTQKLTPPRQISNSLTLCKPELFQARNKKSSSSSASDCPGYCIFVFGGRSVSEAADLEIRTISVSRLEIRLDAADA